MTRDDTITEVRIAKVRVSARTLWRHVTIASQAGLVGVGEATFDAAPPDMDRRLRRAGDALVGKTLNQDMLTALGALTRGGMADATVFSALEQALTDLRGQHAGRPCFQLLGAGAEARPIALYANINRKTVSRKAEDFAANAVQAEREGFRAVKLAPFDDLTPELAESEAGQRLIAAGLERVATVAGAVSPGTELQVDCHWRFSPRTAARLVDALAELGVRWLECPLPEASEAIEHLARIRDQANAAGMRLAGLENFCGWEAFRPFVAGGCYDVIMPDIKHCGGYRMMLEIAEKAACFGVAVSPHNPSGPISHQASVHAATVLGGQERLEIQWRETPLFESITNPPACFEKATSQAREVPGLGLTLAATGHR
ncbi:mandelate racemase/muconate lactonizing enzyme family protein [Modicisalibacter radicis]|uniref:mandelate racemase/muconate lactonizing enzyme family protein n=1 Tax=Halomonas sp. EAR18 TaxID=2518972 RepID=UPI00109C4B22|nr:mandelate racemase/muconate lactonizing enzyme family protein [Halomonas sp. EAR18]